MKRCGRGEFRYKIRKKDGDTVVKDCKRQWTTEGETEVFPSYPTLG